MKRPDAILIAGPTASGKSAAALAVAKAIGGAIVNADSMQVYRDLRILTARPSPAEEAAAPHVLYGHVDAAETYSVGRWLADAEAVLGRLAAEGRVPVIVGGTGLYFRALTEGLSPMPSVPPEIRERLRARLADAGPAALHAELAASDPASAERIAPGDGQRILRALEIRAATGRPISDWQKEAGLPLVDPARAVSVFLDPDRAWLYDRINRRFDAMMAEGALGEVRELAARRLAPDLPAMRAHGVPHFLRQMAGGVDPETALERAKADVRHYAKRQKTWFRHKMAGWQAVSPDDAAAAILAEVAQTNPGTP